MARWVLVSRRRSRRSNPGGGRRVRSIRAALESVMGGSWRYLTEAEKGLVIADVASMVRGGDDGGPWGEFDSSSYEAATILRKRIGGAVNLKSYAQSLAAGRRRRLRLNPDRPFHVGDIVRYRAAFLQSIGWYTNVPVDGKVMRNLAEPFVEVVWSDGQKRTVHEGNLIKRGRPDYSERKNPGSWVARIGKGGKAIGGGATKAEAVKAARIYMKRDPSCKRVWVGRA